MVKEQDWEQETKTDCLDCVHCEVESDGGFIEIERTWNVCGKGRGNFGNFPYFDTNCTLWKKSKTRQKIRLI